MTTTMTTTEARIVGTSCGWTEYNRYLGVCKSCKTTANVLLDHSTYFATEKVHCAACGAWVEVRQVFGRETDRKCSGSCLNAKRSSCECSCGGRNHGQGA